MGKNRDLSGVNPGGMPVPKGSTVAILRVLYESLMPNKKARDKARSLLSGSKALVDENMLLIWDTKAANAYTRLPSTDQVVNAIAAIDQLIAAIPADKSTLRTNFLQQNNEFNTKASQLQTEITEKVLPQYKEIARLHDEIRALIPDNESAINDSTKAKLMTAVEQLKLKTQEFQKLTVQFRNQHADVVNGMRNLLENVTKNSTAPEGTAAIDLPALRGG